MISRLGRLWFRLIRSKPYPFVLKRGWLPISRRDAITAQRRFWKDHSRATAGGVSATGDNCTGADAADVRGGFGAGGFLAAAGGGAAAEGGAAAAERGGGSGFMMLT